MNGLLLVTDEVKITHTVWKPGSMEWRLSAARVELQQLKKKAHVKFAILFARGRAFLFF